MSEDRTGAGTGPTTVAGLSTHNPFEGNRLGIDGLPGVVSGALGERSVTVGFADGTTRVYHHQWLRHCCYCRECGNPADGIRSCTVLSFAADIRAVNAEVEAGDLVVTWPDGHRSVYGADWLIHHGYEPNDAARRTSWTPTTWRAELADDFPTVEWRRAAEGGEGHLAVLENLRDHGIVRVTGLGLDPAGTERLARLLGPIHETTVYGRIYDVRAEPVAKLGAKTGMPQAPHIDDAFYYSPPGIDIFHCLVNTDDGGLSTYVDGFAIAEAIADEVPDAYEALTTLPIGHIRRHPREIDLRSRGPLISTDHRGRPAGIRYFDRALAPLEVAPDQVDRLYDAIRQFNLRMVSSEFVAAIRVNGGDAMLIDNHRVMHGRTAFDPASGRHIRLCHVPRDEFHGRLRELLRALRPDQHDQRWPQGAQTAG